MSITRKVLPSATGALLLCLTWFVPTAVAGFSELVVDGDGALPISEGVVQFGDVECNVTTRRTALLALRIRVESRLWDFPNSAVVALSVPPGGAIDLRASFPSADADGKARIVLPDDWKTLPEGSLSEAVEVSVSVTANKSGAHSREILISATDSDSGTMRGATLRAEWTASGECQDIPWDVVASVDDFVDAPVVSSDAWALFGDTSSASTEIFPGGMREPNTCGAGETECGREFVATNWAQVDPSAPDGYKDLEICGMAGLFLEIYEYEPHPNGYRFEHEAEVPFIDGCMTWRWVTSLDNAMHMFQIGRVPAATGTSFRILWHDSYFDPDTEIVAAPDSLTNSSTASFEFASSRRDATYRCSLDSSSYVDCATPLVLSGLADGSHQLRVAAWFHDGSYDGAIDREPAVHDWVVDLTPPDTIILTAPPLKNRDRTASFTFASSEPFVVDGEELTRYSCSLDGAPFGACGFGGSVDYSSLKPGFHQLQVRASDRAGNEDPSPASYRWLVQGRGHP